KPLHPALAQEVEALLQHGEPLAPALIDDLRHGVEQDQERQVDDAAQLIGAGRPRRYQELERVLYDSEKEEDGNNRPEVRAPTLDQVCQGYAVAIDHLGNEIKVRADTQCQDEAKDEAADET